MNTWFWRCVVMSSWLALLLWCSYWWQQSVAIALLGAGLMACGAGLQLGVQMLMMRAVLRSRGQALPAASVAWRAWLAEWRWAVRIFGWQVPFQEHAEVDGPPLIAPGRPMSLPKGWWAWCWCMAIFATVRCGMAGCASSRLVAFPALP